MKKFIALIVTIVMLTSLFSGCNNNDKDNDSVISTQSDTTPEEVSIRYLTWGYSDRSPSIDLFIKEAKEQLNVKIELENFPSDQYGQTVKTKAAADDLPELVEIHALVSDYVVALMEKDLLLPLNGVVPFDGFNPAAISSNTIDGSTYTITPQASLIGVLYNKKIFNDLGLNVPTNKDEFAAVCNTIKDNGITPIALGAKDAWSLHFIPLCAASEYVLKDYGMEEAIQKMQTGEIRLDDPGFIKAFELAQEFDKNGWFQKNTLGTDVNAATSMIANGQAAMHVNGTWQLSPILDANPDAKIGFMPLVLNDKGTKSTITTSIAGGVCVNAKTKPEKMDAAKKAINLYYTPQLLTALIKDMKGIPTHEGVELDDPFTKDAFEVMQNSIVQDNYEYGVNPGITTDQQIETQAFLMGQKEPADFLKAWQEENAALINKK